MGLTFEILVSRVNDQQMVLSAEEPLSIILRKIPFLLQRSSSCMSPSSYFIWLCAKSQDEQNTVSRKIYEHRTPVLKNSPDGLFGVPHPLRAGTSPGVPLSISGRMANWELGKMSVISEHFVSKGQWLVFRIDSYSTYCIFLYFFRLILFISGIFFFSIICLFFFFFFKP